MFSNGRPRQVVDDSGILITDFIEEYLDNNINYVTCTDIQTDGMLKGPNVALYSKLIKAFPSLKIVASGGVSSIEDLKSLKASGVDGAIVGKAIYEGKVSLKELISI